MIPRHRIIRSLGLPALLIAAVVGLSFAVAAPTQSATVARLAKEGYWGTRQQWNEHSKFIGKSAPKLELSDWKGNAVSSEMMKGKVVIIDFWATWCPPCKKGVPHNNELAKKFAGQALMIGACAGDEQGLMWGVAEETKMAYPTGKATDEVAKAWGQQWFPHYVIIDQSGIIRAIGVQPDAVDGIVEALLSK